MRRVVVLAITMVLAVGGPAHAHVAPSKDDNNRYLKLTPLGDRVRLAYTVFFGEVPGEQVRHTMDADKNGQVSEPEAEAFAARLAAQVADGLIAVVDGVPQRVVWAVVEVGMGNRRVRGGGSFSVDLVAYLCLTGAGPAHRLELRDRFRVPQPGETEVKVEDSPGIAIERARVGPADDASHDYKFVGPGGPLWDDGLDLAFRVRGDVPRGTDGACRQAAPGEDPAEGKGVPAILVIGSAAILGLILAAAATLLARRRR
ncbi:MAG: hypothetical protein KF773_11180 [Deltaproteobacteria bacterium]|nr:hypothetical protein [Deltaproteobacteria bacterium]MCW5803136.1 hypothetical protein [Deltaproteobacteria bacterium]